jgi:hypothetical protein
VSAVAAQRAPRRSGEIVAGRSEDAGWGEGEPHLRLHCELLARPTNRMCQQDGSMVRIITTLGSCMAARITNMPDSTGSTDGYLSANGK